MKVIFHSRGRLKELITGLIEAGVAGLNPIEVGAGKE